MAAPSGEASPFFTAQESTEAAAHVLEGLIHACADILYDHYLAGREAAYGVSRVLGDLQQVVNLVYMPGDGEPGAGELPGLFCVSIGVGTLHRLPLAPSVLYL